MSGKEVKAKEQADRAAWYQRLVVDTKRFYGPNDPLLPDLERTAARELGEALKANAAAQKDG